tara:strand:+ start:73 stop:285 length:213 start_codon:yes stop_codon:yes gene_type:complete
MDPIGAIFTSGYTTIGFFVCFFGIFMGGIYIYSLLSEKYNLEIGFVVLIVLLILSVWAFRFFFLPPFFSF